jgi:FKBP12-rapamycin complex-associated protein
MYVTLLCWLLCFENPSFREYRDSRKIPLNWEHRLMLGMAPDYDHLPVIHKVEVFEYALDSTSGEDLHKVR